jgi:hypothetical protein
MGTPWVLIDGNPIENPAQIFEAVCKGLKSRSVKMPEGCVNFFANQTAKSLRHDNSPLQLAQYS